MKNNIYLLSPSPKEGVNHLPMIDFSITSGEIDFTNIDTLMFSSKQAVISANAIDRRWKEYPCIAIGPATKKMIESLGAEVIYQPIHFYAKTLAKDIASIFRDKHILYLRPKEVSFDSKGFLAKEGIKLEEQILYKTSCLSYNMKEKPPRNAIIIFTSPSSIHCFFKSFNWQSSYRAIVIGDATLEHLPKDIESYVAPTPSIDACIMLAKELSNSK